MSKFLLGRFKALFLRCLCGYLPSNKNGNDYAYKFSHDRAF